MTGTRSFLLTSVLIVALLIYMYAESLAFLFIRWFGTDDYSHGIFVPFISAFLIWQSRNRLLQVPRNKSWWGLVVITAGLFLYVVGELSTLFVVLHASLWIVMVGLAVTLLGIRGTRAIAFPLGYLLTAIPLPTFFYAGLSSQLQLWSSSLGVGCLQLVGVMAFQEGNVIDLGPVQLQVVEACSGIRYLLPLISLALLCAYSFNDQMWKRAVLVLSAIPISIVTNGFRIGMIGVLVELYGKGAAEGFYHLFEGWVVFMVSFGLLLMEMSLLGKLGVAVPRQSWSERLTLRHQELDAGREVGLENPAGNVFSPGPAYLCSVALFAPFTLFSTTVMDREEVPPPRATFVDFPMQIDGWQGEPAPLEKQYIDALRFDDYVLADYRWGTQHPVNFYAAYYRSQRKGQSAHSPQSCLPGGGWEIGSLTQQELSMSPGVTGPLRVNRAVIQKGEQKQIVLYWFKQRDRNLTDEYLVKLYLLWDAFSRQRTDGALVRLASLVGPGESEAVVDQRLQELAIAVGRELTRFVPN
ncbi:MAG: VPLPA-CTERM-specific exosortase XrtD [Nitrospira sp. LK70]|nr:VPLPA-CTERM-specific exosortase XrtD [Nitrospira sp. LK70]